MKKEVSDSVLRKFGNTFVIVVIALSIISLLGFDELVSNSLMGLHLVPRYREVISYTLSRVISLIIFIIIAKIFNLTDNIKWFSKDWLLSLGLLAYLVEFSIGRFYLNFYLNQNVKMDMIFYYSLFAYTLSIGFFEEYVFRGIVFETMKKKYPSENKLNLIFFQAVIFGATHLMNYFTVFHDVKLSLTQILNSTFIGILFGVAYELTNNLFVCCLVHGFWDFSLMFSMAYEGNAGYYDIPPLYGILLVTSSILFYLGTFLILYLRSHNLTFEEMIEQFDEEDDDDENEENEW